MSFEFIRANLDGNLWPLLCRYAGQVDDAVLLESNTPEHPLGRYSLLGIEPFARISGDTRRCLLRFAGDGEREAVIQSPAHVVLEEMLAKYSFEPEENLSFAVGGALGFFSYDYGVSLLLGQQVDERRTYLDMVFGFYDLLVVRDNLSGEVSVFSTGLPEKGARRGQRAEQRLNQFYGIVRKISGKKSPAEVLKLGEISAEMSAQDYCRRVERVRELIAAGDTYQVNLAQQFRARCDGSGFELYRRLARRSPVPMGGFMRFDGRELISLSMERFLRLEKKYIETCPIKGTAPRLPVPEQDEAQRRQLQSSPKNRAELVMIVDLERNDLGQVCEYGSVEAGEIARVETYASVHHLVATVSGRLRPQVSHLQAVAACLPGGSITGAPKRRTVEIISELEPSGRGPYCGSMGYFGFNAVSDFNILIRSVFKEGSNIVFKSGGGITFDSSSREEYEETLHKVRAMFEELSVDSPVGSIVPGEVLPGGVQ